MAPSGAPNVLLIMTDDVGFRASRTFGDPIPTAAFDTRAAGGLLQPVAACQQTTSAQPGMLLLPALNTMFDIAATRAAAFQMHPPPAIFGLLGFLALACALLAGFSMGADRSRSWLHVVGFAAIVALTIYVTMDLEYPRLGLIRVTDFDRLLVDVRATMR
jgi:hypothetical protein